MNTYICYSCVLVYYCMCPRKSFFSSSKTSLNHPQLCYKMWEKKFGLHSSIPTYRAYYITYCAMLSENSNNFLPSLGRFTLCYCETSLGHVKFFNFKILSWTIKTTLCDSIMWSHEYLYPLLSCFGLLLYVST